MAYDTSIADRVTDLLTVRRVAFHPKAMFGGLCFMVDGKMCVGVDSRLMVRLDPEVYEEALTRPGCVPMDFTGRPMRGFVFVNREGLGTARQLNSWIGLALDFNPRAKASKPKKPRRWSRPSKRKSGG